MRFLFNATYELHQCGVGSLKYCTIHQLGTPCHKTQVRLPLDKPWSRPGLEQIVIKKEKWKLKGKTSWCYNSLSRGNGIFENSILHVTRGKRKSTLQCVRHNFSYIIIWIFQENHLNLRGLIQPPIPKEKWLNRNKLICAHQFIGSGLSNKDHHYSVETFCDDGCVLYLPCPVW